MMVGGFSEGRDLSEEELNLVMNMRDHIEETAQKKFDTFEPIKIKSQVVAGMNYVVKIKVSDEEYIHARIFRPLPHTQKPPELSDLELNVTAEAGL